MSLACHVTRVLYHMGHKRMQWEGWTGIDRCFALLSLLLGKFAWATYKFALISRLNSGEAWNWIPNSGSDRLRLSSLPSYQCKIARLQTWKSTLPSSTVCNTSTQSFSSFTHRLPLPFSPYSPVSHPPRPYSPHFPLQDPLLSYQSQ